MDFESHRALFRTFARGWKTLLGIHPVFSIVAGTLYSLIVPVTDRRIASLVDFFVKILDHQYRLAGITPPPSAGATFRLVKGQPRSLIGSQNELIRCALHLFNRPDPSLDGLCHALNCTPMFAIPEVIPADAFAKAIASDPPFRPCPKGAK